MTTRLATHSWSVRRSLAAREPFATHGAFHAIKGAAFDTGRLQEPHRSNYLDAWSDARITYTVLSYRTPIAWALTDGEVIIPPVKYSPTTSSHQSLLYALGQRPGDFPKDIPRQRHLAAHRPTPEFDAAWNDWADASDSPVDLAYSPDYTRTPPRPSAAEVTP